jgi:hypothetical protein
VIIALAATCKYPHQHNVNFKNRNFNFLMSQPFTTAVQMKITKFAKFQKKHCENCDGFMQILNFFKFECDNNPFFLLVRVDFQF